MTIIGMVDVLLAFAFGAACWIAADGRPRLATQWAALFGHALLLGLVAAGFIALLARSNGGTTLATATLPWFALAVIAAAAAAWRATRVPRVATIDASTPLPWWCWVLLASVVLRFALIVDEAWLRPVFPWDAWLAWTAKAKAWFLTSQTQRYVGPDAWFAQVEPLRTSLAYHYPELLSRIELMLAAISGDWNEAVIGIAWPLLWLGLLAGCYCQWRALGVARVPALVAVYLLASLPLLDVHAVLAGYADLWVATALAFALLAWLRWYERRERGQLVLAIVLLAIPPLLKFEGIVWSLGLAMLIAFAAIPRRWRWTGVAVTFALAFAVVGVSLLLDSPWVTMTRKLFSGEAGGHGATWFNVVRALASGLFAQANWNLLWFVVPVVVAWRRRELYARPGLAIVAIYLAGALAFVVALFFLTPAAKWAESNTAVNRLVLQLAPIAVSLVALLLRDVRFGRAPSDTPASSDPSSAAA